MSRPVQVNDYVLAQWPQKVLYQILAINNAGILVGRVGNPDDTFYLRPINGVWQFDIAGRQPTLQFIANSGQNSDDAIDDYAELSNLLARNVYPSDEAIYEAGKVGDLQILDLLASYGIFPHPDAFYQAVGDFDEFVDMTRLLDWLWDRNIRPTPAHLQEMLDDAIQYGYAPRVIWFTRHGIRPSH
jgi:hypothetical protein